MPLYLGLHELDKPTTEDEVRKIFDHYHDTAAKLGCQALGVFANFEQGRNFCLTEADTSGMVWEAHGQPGELSRDSLKEVLEVREFRPSS